MKSNSKIENQLNKKTNSELVDTIIAAKKKKNWKEVAEILSGPRKRRKNLNLGEINKEIKEGEIVVVPGKILSQGEIEKKIKIVALDFSNKAKEKILNAKGDIIKIIDEIKKNPEAKGIKILK